MIKKKRIIRRVRHIVRRISAGKPLTKRTIRPSAPRVVNKHVETLEDKLMNPLEEFHPFKNNNGPSDSGWRNT
jgi:hypothetical protein